MADPMTTDPLERFEAAVRGRVGADANEWLEGLPDLIASMTATWDLHVTAVAKRIDAFGMSIPARRDGERVTLRLAYPDAALADETVALEAWNGVGAVRVLESDPRGAQLRTAPTPGTALTLERNEMRALRLAAETLRSLWIPPPAGIQTLAAEVRAWGATMVERFEGVHAPFEEHLVRDATTMFRSFAANQATPVLLHGDVRLEGFVLDGEHAVALDAKPLIGEPAFDAGSLLRDGPGDLVRDSSAGQQRLQGRLEQLTDLLGLRAGRIRGWAFAVAVDTGLFAYESGDPDGGDLMLEVARLCQTLTV
jgi:streptomycin 6-kinase